VLARGALGGRRAAAHPAPVRGGASRPAPPALTLSVVGITAVLLLPVAAVVVQAVSVGPGRAAHLLTLPLVPTLLANTVMLTLSVTLGCAVIGVAAAWLIERTDIPARRLFAVLLVLPLAVPEFVAGSSWVSILPSVQGFGGAWLVMTLSLYPWVYLPVAATMRRSDPALEDVARSLGAGPVRRFVRVTLPSVRTAVLGGMLVVALYLLAEYGTFAVLRFRTFATEIFNQYSLGFDAASASLLTLVLCLMGVVLLAGELTLRGRSRHPGLRAGRPAAPVRLGWAAPPAVAAMAVLTVLALGVPSGSITYWMIVGSSTTLPSGSVVAATGESLLLGAGAAVVATVLALPMALLSTRHPSALSVALERGAYLVRALPGVAVGLTIVTVAVHHLRPLYQSTLLLEAGYVVLFFPLALIAVRAAIARVPPELEDTARSLGETWVGALRRVTLPLVLPGLAAAAAMVSLSATTELTATLLLRPTGVETLATQFWLYTSNLAYGAAAPYAAIMVVTSAVPVFLLTRLGLARS
jgi:iron(III) transport system permease protein